MVSRRGQESDSRYLEDRVFLAHLFGYSNSRSSSRPPWPVYRPRPRPRGSPHTCHRFRRGRCWPRAPLRGPTRRPATSSASQSPAPAHRIQAGQIRGLAVLIDLDEARRIGQEELLIEDVQCTRLEVGIGRVHEARVVVGIDQRDGLARPISLLPREADLTETVGVLKLLRRVARRCRRREGDPPPFGPMTSTGTAPGPPPRTAGPLSSRRSTVGRSEFRAVRLTTGRANR